MRENYRPIGDFIRVVNQKNKDMAITQLIGLSIDKCYIPSVANVIGTDLSTYKIIKRNQFACSLMQVSRDEKIPIACMTEYDEAIMSPAYVIFEIADESVLLPEYLNMWVMRAEFDREASFLAVGGVRGSLAWDDFCRVKLPVPSIDEQENIVKAYKTITDRIALKKQINDNLEAQALAYYKLTVNNCSENDIVEGTVGDIGEFVRGKNITAAEMVEGNIPVISAGLSPSGMHNAYNVKGPSITVSGSGVNAGYVSFHQNDIWAADCSYNNSSEFIYCLFVILKDIQSQITELQKGTAQPHVYPKELNPFAIKYPKKSILMKMEESFKAFFTTIEENNSEIKALQEVQAHFLSLLSR